MNFIVAKRKELVFLVNQHIIEMKQLTPMWRDDEKFIIATTTRNCDRFKFASARLQGDAQFVYDLIIEHKCGIRLMYYVDATLADDFDFIVRILVNYFGAGTWENSLDFAKFPSPRLRTNIELLLLIYSKIRISHMEKLVLDALTDRGSALMVMRANGGYLNLLSDEFCDDYEMVMTAVGNNGSSLFRASARLQADKNIVLVAVHTAGSIFGVRAVFSNKYRLHKKFEYDVDVAKVALMSRPNWFLEDRSRSKFNFDGLLRDEELVRELMQTNAEVFRWVGAQWRDDMEVAYLAVIFSGGSNAQWVSLRLRNNAHFAFRAITLFDGAYLRKKRITRTQIGADAVMTMRFAGARFNKLMSSIGESIRPRLYRVKDVLVCCRLAERA